MIQEFLLEEIFLQMLPFILILLLVPHNCLIRILLYVELLDGGKSVALKLMAARNMITNGTSLFFLDVER